MNSAVRHSRVAALLFCSGLCALIYQTAWLREFRLIFGASTGASAAVLGIFMGGLGLGSAWLGRRSERARQPLVLYGNLEFLIALSAAATPGLVWLARQIYIATGGTMVLGQGAGTAVRLALSALVLIVPTFLMGGTLPAAARAVSSDEDVGRRGLALLYGCNTLGAVLGAALSTFFLIEALGNRTTLWAACALNLLVAVIARALGRSMPVIETREPEIAPAEARASWRFVVVSAAVVGFAFMLMELVWYRMLGPLLGGSTFTFGLILVVALLGIGLGGGLYALLSADRSPTLGGFALTCALEGACIAAPYALGDRLALLTLMLRPLGALGFAGQVLGWAIVALIVVLPAALVAGWQFPMLIALLGRGRADVGRHTGLAYAANTAGAIVGSLVGGFGLLPLLTAPGVWKAVVVLLAALAFGAALLSMRKRERAPLGALGWAAASLAMLAALGPTAAWRHSGIGAGRSDPSSPNTNYFADWSNFARRSIVWEAEGVESSVGLSSDTGFAFVINGKIDGNSRLDAGTQVMGGLIGAMLHPAPKRAMVIGLGTGSTAGWLADVPTMERVDAIELEPAILEVARRCAPVNRDVMANPKVRHHIGDAREVLLTTPERYDIIFSEPSNPYRAGIASLFTQDFYRAVTKRLAPGGIFLQWLQAYDIDGEAIRNVYATLGSVFPSVETWRTQSNDLLLVATLEPLAPDAAQLRERIATEPLRSALALTWRVDSLEGVFSHYIGNDTLARRVVDSGEPVSTDDRNALEFGFARGVGRRKGARISDQVVAFAKAQHIDRPAHLTGEIDWALAAAQEPTADALQDYASDPTPDESALRKAHREFMTLHIANQPERAAALLANQPIEPLNLLETETLAEVWASAGSDSALPFIEKVRTTRPADAEALRGRLLAAQQQWPDAAEALLTAFDAWHTDPWASIRVVHQALAAAQAVANACGDAAVAQRLYDALHTPFSVDVARERRLFALVEIAKHTGPNPHNPRALEALEPYAAHPIWRKDFLEQRALTYRALGDPRAAQSLADLRDFLDHEPVRFDNGIQPPQKIAREP